MSEDEENTENDDTLSISRSPLRRMSLTAQSTAEFQDLFEPLPLLPGNEGSLEVQRRRMLAAENRRQREYSPSRAPSEHFQSDDTQTNTSLHAQQIDERSYEHSDTQNTSSLHAGHTDGRSYDHPQRVDRTRSSHRHVSISQRHMHMEDPRLQSYHPPGGTFLYAGDYRGYTSNRGMEQHAAQQRQQQQQQQPFMAEGFRGHHRHAHHDPYYYPMHQGGSHQGGSRAPRHLFESRESHSRRDMINAKRSYEEYTSSYPDETHSEERAEDPLTGQHSADGDEPPQNNPRGYHGAAINADEIVSSAVGRQDFESNFQHEDSEINSLLYSHTSHHSRDEGETSNSSVARSSRRTEIDDTYSQPQRRMTRNEYFASLESDDAIGAVPDPHTKKLKSTESEDDEEDDYHAELDGDMKLVEPEDKMFSTSFSFAILSEIQPCRFEPADMKGKRRGLSVGFPGLACQYCKGDSLNNGRFFPSSIKTMSDTSKLLMPLYNHLIRCKKCPQEVKDKLTSLQKEHEKERKLQTFGSQKAFFMKIWGRLHGELPTQKGCTGRGKSFRLLLGTSKTNTKRRKNPDDDDSDES